MRWAVVGDPGNQGTAPVSILKPTPSADEIITAVYDSSYSVPDGFFVDERADTSQSYSVYHVKDPSVSYELCTDDYAEAMAWEDADNLSRTVNGYYVDTYDNDIYFEFIRDLSFPDDVGNVAGATSPGFARVFKCSSINRNGVDRNVRDGYAGTINSRPLTTDVVRRFTEYLWQFTFFETSQRKVLDSFGTEREDKIDHTLVLAFAFKQGFGQCDRIEVVDWTYSADKASGEVTKDFRFLFSIEARLVDGSPEQC